jgi:hypothetical protein
MKEGEIPSFFYKYLKGIDKMITFREFSILCEKYSDEHAHRKAWNHFITHKKHGESVRGHLAAGEHDKALSHMKSEVEKAKSDPKHPLSFEKSKRGYSKSGKTNADKEGYHKEMDDAVHGVHALASHKKMKGAVEKRHPARVTGGSDPDAKLSKTWKSGGGTNKTPKGDLEVYNPKNKKERRGVSMKKGGGAQLASAEPGEMGATYKSAAKSYTQRFHGHKPKSERKKIQADIEKKAGVASKLLARMKTGSEGGNELRKKAAQRKIDRLHGEHPQLTRHVSQASTSGDAKFGGKNKPGTAGLVLTGKTSKSDANAKSSEQQTSAKPRAAKPKGRNRSGNLKVDYKG